MPKRNRSKKNILKNISDASLKKIMQLKKKLLKGGDGTIVNADEAAKLAAATKAAEEAKLAEEAKVKAAEEAAKLADAAKAAEEEAKTKVNETGVAATVPPAPADNQGFTILGYKVWGGKSKRNRRNKNRSNRNKKQTNKKRN
jgi:membrane protein involved in colicin uptake